MLSDAIIISSIVFIILIPFALIMFEILGKDDKSKSNLSSSDHGKTKTLPGTPELDTQETDELDFEYMEKKLKLELEEWKAKNSDYGVNQNSAMISFNPNLSENDVVLNASRPIEQLLEQKLGAYGKGLHSKLSSVEQKVPSNLVKTIRWIATVRNQTVHSKPTPFNRADYISSANQVISYLEKL